METDLALYALDKQLNENNKQSNITDDGYSISSRKTILFSERKFMDQNSREIRLKKNIGSPLGGMTIDELADRGLLEGNALVPEYHTSLKQRSRRPLELKNRSSRLQDREAKVNSFASLIYNV